MIKKIILTLVLLLVPFTAHAADKNESVYDRVMRTGAIRCGYGLWPPYLMKDPNTGAFSGIYFDFMQQLGRALSLKIKWTEEIGWGDYLAALDNDRFDAYCTIVGYNAERARLVDFTTPLFYLASDIWVREGDTRFDHHPELLNDPTITFSTLEGDLYNKITKNEFSKAKLNELPQLATMAELFMNVANGKADATITETSAGYEFLKNNPGSIRRVALDGGFRAVPGAISIKGGEYRFKRMLDIAIIDLMSSGTLDSILNDYDTHPGAILRVARPYETPQ